MTKILSSIAAVSLVLSPAIAHAEETAPISFRHDGVTYTYTVEQTGDRRILRGVSSESRTPFVLNVGKRRVSGTVDGSDVTFSLNSVKRVKGIVVIEQLAAR
jgi:hypothetical protein